MLLNRIEMPADKEMAKKYSKQSQDNGSSGGMLA